MDNLLIIILCVIFFVLMIVNQYLYREYYENYLFPIKGLYKECKDQNKDYKAASLPMSCVIDGKLKQFTNCKCVGKDGLCKTCYPQIKKNNNRSSVYNPNEFMDKKEDLSKRINEYVNNTKK